MVMTPAAILPLAAGLDWLEGLLPLLFVAIWLVSQVANLFRGGRNQPVQPPQLPPGRGEAAPQDRGEIDREVEAFLRRTLRRDEERMPPDTAAGKRSRRRAPPANPPEPPPAPSRPRPVAREARDDVAGHVAAAFAHDLAHESPDDTAMSAAPAAAAPAADLAAALRRPGGLRQLVLVKELLERPTHRW